MPMARNYKVFLRDSLIEFKQGEPTGSKDLGIRDFVNMLTEEGLPSHIVIQSTDPEAKLDSFLRSFKTIEAAGGIVINPSNGKILLIERFGLWDLPKGKLDAGEKPDEAALREVEEECGVDGLVMIGLIGVTYHGYMMKEDPCIKRTYWYKMECRGNTTTTGQLEEGITQAIWCENSKVSELLKRSYRSIQELWSDIENDF